MVADTFITIWFMYVYVSLVPSHYFEACKQSVLGKAGWPFFGVETGTKERCQGCAV